MATNLAIKIIAFVIIAVALSCLFSVKWQDKQDIIYLKNPKSAFCVEIKDDERPESEVYNYITSKRPMTQDLTSLPAARQATTKPKPKDFYTIKIGSFANKQQVELFVQKELTKYLEINPKKIKIGERGIIITPISYLEIAEKLCYLIKERSNKNCSYD